MLTAPRSMERLGQRAAQKAPAPKIVAVWSLRAHPSEQERVALVSTAWLGARPPSVRMAAPRRQHQQPTPEHAAAARQARELAHMMAQAEQHLVPC
eukprot:1381081-Prymnesium_polylepis.1